VGPPGLPRPRALAEAVERGRHGHIATDLGERTDDRHAIGLGRTAMLPTRMARAPPLRVDTALPVQRQPVRRRLLGGLEPTLRQDGAAEAFFEPLWGRGLMPHRAQGLAQAEERPALLLTERDVPLRQRRAVRLRVLPPCQRRVPALFACPRSHTVCGSGQVLVPTGPLGVIARFVQCQCSRLPLRVLWGGDLRKRLQGGMDTSGGAGLQHGRFDGAIHPQPANRSARGGAAIHPASAADISGDPAGGAPRGDRALTPTTATTPQATAQGRPPLRGATGPFLRHVPLGLQALLGVQKGLPTAVPWGLVPQQNTPRRHRLFPALALRRPPGDAHELGCRAARDPRPSIVRRAQHLMEALPTGQAPADSPAYGPRADCRQRQLRLTRP
jgi:hypothetical protein